MGKDPQGVDDVLEEIHEQGSKEDHEGESTHEYDGSAIRTDGGSNQIDDASSKKRKAKSSAIESSTTDSILNAAKMLGNDMKEICKDISRSIGVELTIQEKAQELYGVLKQVEGLTNTEMFFALRKILDHPTQMLVFFSLPTELKLEWVRDFLENTS
ncbi:hypothetical protein M5689_001100 [Euphorbia peplus]|nr:hypothetical protein M5689_001100 [Euphorbia peplus]